MMAPDPYDVVRISFLPKIGPTRGRTLLRAFGSFDALRSATRGELCALNGFNDAMASSIHTAMRDVRAMANIEHMIEKCRMRADVIGARLVTFQDTDYPRPLARIYDPPLFLFLRGTLLPTDEKAVAVVGTRAPSEYGRRAAEAVVRVLCEAGICVVSGLAHGIDTVAHRAALQFGGRTLAVLGSGVGNVYPSINRDLSTRIVNQGALLSELAVDAKPDAVNFPRRNRIISGLSMAVVLVESGERGGAILTAEFAIDQNRDVFAIPGSMFCAQAAGPHALIRKGTAHLLASPEQIFDELPLLRGGAASVSPAIQMTLEEEMVHATLSSDPLHIDALAAMIALPTQDILVHLLAMEFKGLVRQLPGKHFIRI